ncbi:MAG: CARDB domain-containing protein [Methanobacteriota archaeon]
MKIKNLFALAIVGAMLASAFAGLAAADIISVDDDRELYIVATDLDNRDYFPGEQDIDFYIQWYNQGGDISTTDTDLTAVSCTVNAVVRNLAGAIVNSPVSWDENTVDYMGTWHEGNFATFNNFQFDVVGNAKPGVYNLTVTLTFTDAAETASETEYITFEILQCAFVNDVGGLIPGDSNRKIGVYVSTGMTGEDLWPDITLTLTRNNTAFTWFGSTGATSTSSWDNPIYSWAGHTFQFLISVSPSMKAGDYDFQYSINYTNDDDVHCTETGVITVTVGHLAMIGTTTAVASIEQGTTKANFTLVISNTGTVNLYGLKLRVDPASMYFTVMPADHWEGSQPVSYAEIEVGDIAVGGSVSKTMVIGFNAYIPEGRHKLMFGFDCFYYDPISRSYLKANSTWLGNPCYPYVTMDGNGFGLSPDESTVDGPFVMLDVVDSAMDVSLQSTTVLYKSLGLIDNELDVKVLNYGYIDYDNVVLTMLTNSPDSPFLNAVDPTAASSEDVILPGILGATDSVWPVQSEYTVTFRVTLRTDAEMGVFNVPVTARGINKDMGVEVEATLNARVTIAGVGPKLVVTSSTPSKINPGSNFVLTLTIENQGDDTARNVVMFSINGGTWDSLELNGELAAPVPMITPLVLPDIAPGDNITVTIAMKSPADMSNGHVYMVELGVSFIDSYADPYSYSNAQTTYFQVSVKTNGMGGSSLGNLFFILTLVGIVVMIFLCVYTVVWARKNWVPRRKKGASPYIVGSEQPPQPPQ